MKYFPISIVIPYHNSQSTLGACLEAVWRFHSPDQDEVILVDDGSTDRSAEQARAYEPRFLSFAMRRNRENLGAAAARNVGALEARHGIVLFVDSDAVIVSADRERLRRAFASDDGVAGVQGIYDMDTPVQTWASQYKNIFYHYHHMKIPGETAQFTSTYFLAVRKDLFFRAGAFNPNIKGASVEDGELGFALISRGYKIVLDKRSRVQHLADYTFYSLMRRSFCNAAEKMRSVLRKGNQLRVDHSKTEHPVGKLISIGICGAIIPALTLSLMDRRLAPLAAALILIFVLLNLEQYVFVIRKRGFVFAMIYMGFLFADLCVSCFGLCFGAIRR